MATEQPASSGHRANASDIRRVAKEPYSAAYRVAEIRPGEPLSAAPLRLLALHAVELNQSALPMLKRGHRVQLSGRFGPTT